MTSTTRQDGNGASSMDSPPPPTIIGGRGSHVWDTNGHRYIDWICGYGPIVLGHGDIRVASAVFQQMLTGTLLPGASDIEHALGERLLSWFPHADGYRFFKTGSEAVAAAVRLARAHTGRSRVLRVGFHGWHDGLIDSKIGWHNWDNLRTPASDVPGALRHDILGIEANQAGTIAEIETRIRDTDEPPVAALLLDPVQLANPAADLPPLRQACNDTTTLFILDETKTAFRVALGGVQELYGVDGDITIAGKALANGLPLSSVLGPSDLLHATETRVKGTFNGERAALAAAHTTLDILEHEQVCKHLSVIGGRLMEGINSALRESSLSDLIQAVPYRWNCMPHIHAATDDPIAREVRRRFIQSVQVQGVLLLERHNSFVCSSHSDEDVRRTVEITHDSAKHLAVAP